MSKIAINGFGRIGRAVFRIISENHPEVEIVAINDLANTKTLAHLLKYDSLYGIYQKEVKAEEDSISVGGKKVKIFAEMDPAKLPWKDLKVDVVLECTGEFTKYEEVVKHIEAGAKRVVISAPSKDPEKIPSYLFGVNMQNFDSGENVIFDMGSCTTNCLAPVAKILNDNLGIERGFMTTVHSYTNDQRILDLAHKDLRRARAGALNIIPTTTGAAKAIGNVIPELKGKLDGIALRVPTPTVSVLDLVCLVKRKTTAEEVNGFFKKAAESKEMKGVFKVEEKPLVSSDFIGDSYSSIVDAALTMVKDDVVKIIAWYDNEWGYASRLAEFAEFLGKNI